MWGLRVITVKLLCMLVAVMTSNTRVIPYLRIQIWNPLMSQNNLQLILSEMHENDNAMAIYVPF